MLDLGSATPVNAELRRAFSSIVATLLRPVVLGILTALLATVVARPALGQQPSASTKTKAAEHYDRGVDHFERAQYAAAVKEFLAADELVPSSDALSSAIAAARRSNDHLLVLRASQRAIARESVDPKLAAGARAALAEASRHLARIEASCEPAPCSLELDGSTIPAGTNYALPGTHTIVAKAEGREPSEERLAMAAGASYRVSLTLKPTAGAPLPAPAPAAPPVGPPDSKPGPAAPTDQKPPVTSERARKDRPLPPVAFYAGAGVTGVLLILTTWSGIDTLSARDDLPERPTRDQIDDVEGRITRTDVLLAATVLVGAATGYAGIALVNWEGKGSARMGVAPTAGGFQTAITGRF
jgi:hypothetical protein